MRVSIELERVGNGDIRASFHGNSITADKLWSVMYRLADNPFIRRRLYTDEERRAHAEQADETLGVPVDGV